VAGFIHFSASSKLAVDKNTTAEQSDGAMGSYAPSQPGTVDAVGYRTELANWFSKRMDRALGMVVSGKSGTGQ